MDIGERLLVAANAVAAAANAVCNRGVAADTPQSRPALRQAGT